MEASNISCPTIRYVGGDLGTLTMPFFSCIPSKTWVWLKMKKTKRVVEHVSNPLIIHGILVAFPTDVATNQSSIVPTPRQPWRASRFHSLYSRCFRCSGAAWWMRSRLVGPAMATWVIRITRGPLGPLGMWSTSQQNHPQIHGKSKSLCRLSTILLVQDFATIVLCLKSV